MAFITNHSYLDNPTFRGMRRSLMKTFNEIYILDLHGNSVKKEICPDGTKDENIFDIRQGVAISIFIKNKGKSGCKIKHADLWSLRETKYEWLNNNDFTTTNWTKLIPKADFYLFIKRKEELEKEYNNYFKVNDIFPISSVGIVTSRDNFVTDHNKNILIRRLRMFADTKLTDEILSETFNIKNKENWKVNTIRKKIRKDHSWENSIFQINYRPFDTKWIAYLDYLIERPRKEVMQHMFKDNIGLCVGRAGSVVGLEQPWNLAFVSKDIVDLNLFYRGGELLFPLYLYNESNEKKKPGTNLSFVFEPEVEYQTRRPNISDRIFNLLKDYYGKNPTPEEIFYYVYSILYCPTFRIRFAEFLKIDFPRIPFTKEYKLFIELNKLGKRIADLHILDSKELDPPVARYQGEGDNDIIEKIVYNQEKQRIYINKEKYFEGIKPEVWNYFIGGYKVIEKYIKSRKGKSMENPVEVCKIISSIELTIALQDKINYYFKQIKADSNH